MGGAVVITLLTDFGTTDSYVAEIKGVLLGRVPGVTLVDLTHDVPPGDIATARYLLGRTWHRFPPSSVHLAIVDPGVGSDRRALAMSARNHAFVAPDNGLLTPVLDGAEVVALPIPSDAAPTFHGRDVFAPAAAALAAGVSLGSLGTPVPDPIVLPTSPPTARDGALLGTVIHVDRFGTLVTDLPGGAAEEGVLVVADRRIGPVRRTFADVPVGSVVALRGSGGTVEIAVRDGSAMAVLGAGRGTPVRLIPA